MKNIKICLIVIMSAIIAGLCVLLVSGLRYSSSARYMVMGMNNENMQLILDKEVSLEGIDNILVSYLNNNNDVFFYKGEGNMIHIKEYTNFEAEESEITKVSVNGGTLKIEGTRRKNHKIYFAGINGFGWNNGLGYTEIWLPESYKGSLAVQTVSGDIWSETAFVLDGSFTASSTSGDMNIPEISAGNTALSSSSGEIIVDTISVTDETQGTVGISTISGDIRSQQITGTTTISVTSGNIHMKKLSGAAMFSTVSGDVVVEAMDGNASVTSNSGDVRFMEGIGTRDISTISGDITLMGSTDTFVLHTTSGNVVAMADKGAGEVNTTNGDIRIELPILTGNLVLHTTSGEVSVVFSEEDSFDFKASTTSGDINTFFDNSLSFSKKGNKAEGRVGTDTQGRIVDVQTVSGDVRFKKYHQ